VPRSAIERTLYGILDVNYQRNDPEVGDATDGINGSHNSGNRFGLRGSEALGGGWSAVFTLEGGFNIDTGTSGQASGACVPTSPVNPANACGGATQNRLFGRQAGGPAAAGTSSWPRCLLSSGVIDLFGFVRAAGFGIGLQSTFFCRLGVYNALQVAYLGRLHVRRMYCSTRAVRKTGSGNDVDVIGLGGSWGAVRSMRSSRTTFRHPGRRMTRHLQIGGTFDLKIVKLHAAYAIETSSVFSTVGMTSGADSDAWARASVPLFGGNSLLPTRLRRRSVQLRRRRRRA
jgi:hypothetical protein